MTITQRLKECSAIKMEAEWEAKYLLNSSQSKGSGEISKGTGEQVGPGRRKGEREREQERKRSGEKSSGLWKPRQGATHRGSSVI